MKVAIVGCAHGELDKIYEAVQHLETANQIRIAFIICCGDFQSVRNYVDLNSMAVPPKFRQMNTFYKYYSGVKEAPYLTLFVGGNHEASNYLAELPYGGWVAPRIYYFGYANVLNIANLRIAGVSGIYKHNDYRKNHFETPPYTEDTKRSAYHMRQVDIFRLKQLRQNNSASLNDQMDIVISHDWPRGVHAFGDERELFHRKPYFRQEADEGRLGNPATAGLLSAVRPKYWFSAHMHVKFPALITHEDGRATRFLALNKCLPHREYIQILDFGDEVTDGQNLKFSYDPEWLAILKSTDFLTEITNSVQYMPGRVAGSDARYEFTPTDEEIQEIRRLFNDDFTIPDNFRQTAPPYVDGQNRNETNIRPYYANPQTTEFCRKLSIKNLNLLMAQRGQPDYDFYDYEQIFDQSGAEASGSKIEGEETENPDEIRLENEEEEEKEKSEEKEKPNLPSKRPLDEEDFFEDRRPGNPEKTEDSASCSDVMKKFKRRNAEMYTEQNE